MKKEKIYFIDYKLNKEANKQISDGFIRYHEDGKSDIFLDSIERENYDGKKGIYNDANLKLLIIIIYLIL